MWLLMNWVGFSYDTSYFWMSTARPSTALADLARVEIIDIE